jgi:hypothetical protein
MTREVAAGIVVLSCLVGYKIFLYKQIKIVSNKEPIKYHGYKIHKRAK